jgi:hypothetical protein
VLAHPTGIVEGQEGRVVIDGDALQVHLASTCIGRTASAKEVTALERIVRVEGDTLTYDVRMAAVGLGLTDHLAATLHRQPA